jgi:hypothetical protein
MADDTKPLYYPMLLEHERYGYDALQSRLADPNHRYNRNRRLDTFQGILEEIREFCEGPDSWRRCLACGICWGSDFIATNTQHMKFIIGKSKSSINGVFAKMRLDISGGRDTDTTELVARIPYLKGRLQEVRQWTIRRKPDPSSPATPVPFEPEPYNFLFDEEFSMEDPFREKFRMADAWADETRLQNFEFKFQPEDAKVDSSWDWGRQHFPAM